MAKYAVNVSSASGIVIPALNTSATIKIHCASDVVSTATYRTWADARYGGTNTYLVSPPSGPSQNTADIKIDGVAATVSDTFNSSLIGKTLEFTFINLSASNDIVIGSKFNFSEGVDVQISRIEITDINGSRDYLLNEGTGVALVDSLGDGSTDGTYINPPAADAQWILLPSGLSTVSNAISIDWNMLAEVSNGYQSLWNLLNFVSGKTSVKWDLLQGVLSNSELNWSLVESINNNVQFDWDLLAALAAVSNSTQAKWNLLSQISNDLDVEWDLLASVGSSIQLNWDLLSALASVSRGVQLKWDMAGQVKAQLDARWNLLEAVGVTADLRWNLAVNVANQVQAQWDLLQGIKSNVDLVWDSIAATSNGLEFRWSLLSESVRIPIHVMLVLNEDRIMKILN